MPRKTLPLALLLLVGWVTIVTADAPRALPQGKLPNDARLAPLRNLDSYFPFTPPKTADEWRTRADAVRRQTLLACGLWPLPAECGQPVQATIHGKIDRDEYTVERVFFQSAPGLYVTGSLYRPKGKSGKLPAVLCPHGHWNNGRFHTHGASIKQELASKGETFEIGGKHPLQARSVQLARMGCVVFFYDMLGYADSVPITQEIAHGFRKQRPSLSTAERFGLFSAQAESRLISVMGLQTFNSIRALDFLSSLPDVDAKRIGVTGASGGGTQTFILGAIDSRPATAFPAVMVSTAMQGGCTCENACYLRVGTGNIEFAAMFAPRPLAMSSANDWTKELLTKGYPEIKQLYSLLGAPDKVYAEYHNFGHNYNQVARTMMYEWFNKHLSLGQKSPIVERDYKPLSIDEMTVWTADHPKPKMDEAAEAAMVRGFADRSQSQIAALAPRDAKSLAEYRRVVGGAFQTMIGRDLATTGEVEHEATAKNDRGDYLEIASLVRNKTHGEEIPALFLMPKKWNKQVVVWVTGKGKNAILDDSGKPTSAVRKLLDGGFSVAAADLLYQGEFLADGQPLTKTRRIENNREFAGYTLGYNHPLFAQRVHDVLTLVAMIKRDERGAEKIHVAGVAGGGPIAAAAAFAAGDAIDRVAIDAAGFRFASIDDIRDPMFWPGAVKYGDLAGLLSLIAPRPLWMSGDHDFPAIVSSTYNVAGGARMRFSGGENEKLAALATWLAGAK